MADQINQGLQTPGHKAPLLRPWVLGLLVLLAAMAAYLPSFRAEFLVIDDPQYVTGNPYVLYPSWKKVGWFFSEIFEPSTVLGYYQPLTMVSLMLDRVIEGMLTGGYAADVDPFIFHLDNVFLHGVNAALIFALCLLLTGSRGIAVFCGLVFAVHPLNVEVVSWVCQRKAILATTFALLMVLSHAKYARCGRGGWMAAAIAAFVLSILAKPTSLFLPGVLLLMDVWPLRRFSRQAVIEKAPLFGIALVGGYVAYRSQVWGVDLSDQGADRPPGVTLLVACHNLVFYLAKMFVPIRLCPQYIMPDESTVRLVSPPFLAGVVGTAALVGAAAWAVRRRVDFFWTLLASLALLIGPTLTPVRFMGTIAADRFAYTPMVVVLVLVAELLRRAIGRWGINGEASKCGFAEAENGPGDGPSVSVAERVLIGVPFVGIGVAVIALFAVLAVRQQQVWQNSFSYYQAIIDRFPDAPAGYYGIGNAWLDTFQRARAEEECEEIGASGAYLDRALEAYRLTLERDPTYSQTWYRLGHIQILRGRVEEGIQTIRHGLTLPRSEPEGYLFLGFAYTHAGMYEEAIEPYEKCLERQQSWSEVRKNLANALLRTGRASEALPHYERLYELDPTDLDGLQNWGVALLTVGRVPEAIERLRAVVSIREDIETAKRGATAAPLAEPESADNAPAQGPGAAAQTASPSAAKLADARFTLAGALCQGGSLDEAAAQLEKALVAKPELLDAAAGHPAFARLRETAEWQRLAARAGRAASTAPAGHGAP